MNAFFKQNDLRVEFFSFKLTVTFALYGWKLYCLDFSKLLQFY